MTDIDIVGNLCDKLGPTLVAMLSGLRTRCGVDGWLDGSGEPSAEQMKRLRVAHELFGKVAASDGEDTARQWFISANVVVDSIEGESYIAPCEALRKARHDDEFRAGEISARRFVEDTFGY